MKVNYLVQKFYCIKVRYEYVKNNDLYDFFLLRHIQRRGAVQIFHALIYSQHKKYIMYFHCCQEFFKKFLKFVSL